MNNYLEQLNPVQRATLIWLALMVVTILAALMSIFLKVAWSCSWPLSLF